MHSHISIVANGHSKYIQDVTRNQCNEMHTIGRFWVTSSLQISKLKGNETLFHNVTIASSVTPNGDCTGTCRKMDGQPEYLELGPTKYDDRL